MGCWPKGSERFRNLPKITQFVYRWWSPNSSVYICMTPKAILPLSPSAPLPHRGWGFTSGSQMTPQEGRQRPGDSFGGKGTCRGTGWPSSLCWDAPHPQGGRVLSSRLLSLQLLLGDNVLLITLALGFANGTSNCEGLGV